MRRRSLAAALLGALLCTARAASPVEVNSADQAALEQVKGIGPVLSEKILAERARRPFADWAELLARIKGLKPASARRLSDDGLTVNGRPYDPREASR